MIGDAILRRCHNHDSGIICDFVERLLQFIASQVLLLELKPYDVTLSFVSEVSFTSV
jgi:hypothetical protein